MNRPPIQQSEYPPYTTTRNSAAGTITCTICQAVYAPSRSHIFLQQAPPIALESAFMSMCHFCFRCRRPACPNCWDDIHGVCAQCTQEMRIPFRVETPPLKGTAPLSSQPIPLIQERSTPPSLISIHPGRFQAFSTPPPPTTSTVMHSEPVTTQQVVNLIATSSSLDIDRIATRPDRSGLFDIDKVTTQPDRNSHNATRRKTRSDHAQNTKQHPVHTFIAIALLLFLFLLIVIATAQLSPDINLFIANMLHIDIRVMLSYLWRFLQNLF